MFFKHVLNMMYILAFRFVYTGKLRLNVSEFPKMLYALSKYQFDDYESSMDCVLSKLLTIESACVLLVTCNKGFDKSILTIIT